MNITSEAVTEYINSLYEPLNEELKELRISAEEDRVPIILKETESFLRFITELERPKKILEIGTAVGYSSCLFAFLGADVTTVEKSQPMAEAAAANIKKLGLDHKITVLTGDGEEAIKSNLTYQDVFDMVFIDAAKSHYKRFLDAALSHCAKGSVIISDNVLLKGDTAAGSQGQNKRFKTNIKNMRRYLEYISDHPLLDTVIISCGDGLALSRYK